MPAEQIFI